MEYWSQWKHHQFIWNWYRIHNKMLEIDWCWKNSNLFSSCWDLYKPTVLWDECRAEMTKYESITSLNKLYIKMLLTMSTVDWYSFWWLEVSRSITMLSIDHSLMSCLGTFPIIVKLIHNILFDIYNILELK